MVGSYVSAHRLDKAKLLDYLQRQFPDTSISVEHPASQKTEYDSFFVDAPESLTPSQIEAIGELRAMRKRIYNRPRFKEDVERGKVGNRVEVEVDNDDSKTKDIISAVSADVSAPSPRLTWTDEEQLELLVQELATFLQHEDKLARLFREAISAVRPDLFEEKVAALLARYSQNLEKGATLGFQSEAVFFVWEQRLRIAKIIRAQMSSGNDPAFRTSKLDHSDAIRDTFGEIREFLSSEEAIESFQKELRQWLKLCYDGSEEDQKRQERRNQNPSGTVLARNIPSGADYDMAKIGASDQGVESMDSSGGKTLRDEERQLPAASISETLGSHDSENPENRAPEQQETVPEPPVSAETLLPRSQHRTQWQKLCFGLFSYRPRNLACLLDDIVYMLPFRQKLSYLLAPRVSAGKTRIWWRCANFHAKSCGEIIFDDVCMSTTDTDQRDNDTRPGFQQLDLEQGPSSSQEQSSSNWVLNSCISLLGSLKRLGSQPKKIQEQPAPNGHRSSAPPDLPRDLFLFLCIGKEGELTFYKVSLEKCKTDKELFNLLKEQYYSIRSPNGGWLTLKTPKKISLVRICLLLRQLVVQDGKPLDSPGVRAEAHELDRRLGPPQLVRFHKGNEALDRLLHAAVALLGPVPDTAGENVNADARCLRPG
ncbi:hypothetical protein PG984_002795 [Apiospora sp. TS-2023a]